MYNHSKYILYMYMYIISKVLCINLSLSLPPPVPPIPVSLSPSSIEVPNFQPYNSIVFNCSIIIPQGHSITSSFNWFVVNGASSELLLHGHNGTKIVTGEHSSSLSFYATNAGQAKYRCSVMLGFPSPDPNITINANSTVNVIGKWINVQYTCN